MSLSTPLKPAGWPLLETRTMCIGYAVSAGHGGQIAGPLDIRLKAGELVCLLGPNGAGKSTLLRSLAGLQPLLSGSVSLDGQPLEKLKREDIARHLAVVLTGQATPPLTRVYDLVALGRLPHTNWLGRLTELDESRIELALQQVEMVSFAGRLLSELSDGERQRVLIARALAQDTPLILLDEPTVHLDLPNRVEIMRLLQHLVQHGGKAVLMSTHELDLALQLADRIWLLREGRGLVSGLPEDLVLDGVIRETFERDSFRFDMQTGGFQIVALPKRGAVQLEGEGVRLIWTRRALQRNGWEVLTAGQAVRSVGVRAADWLVSGETGSGQVCASLEEVLEHLGNDQLQMTSDQ